MCPDISDVTVIGSSSAGGYYVDVNDEVGAQVFYQYFLVEGGPATSSYTRIRYANGSENTLRMGVLNSDFEVYREIEFPPTGGWDQWQTLQLSYVLTRNVYLEALDNEGGPNLGDLTAGLTINTSGEYGYGYAPASGCPDQRPAKRPDISCTVSDPALWTGGYVFSDIVVTNDGESAITDWKTFLWPDTTITVDYSWNADIAVHPSLPSGLVATPLYWNQRIEPGQSVHFGFMGPQDGSLSSMRCVPRVEAFESE